MRLTIPREAQLQINSAKLENNFISLQQTQGGRIKEDVLSPAKSTLKDSNSVMFAFSPNVSRTVTKSKLRPATVGRRCRAGSAVSARCPFCKSEIVANAGAYEYTIKKILRINEFFEENTDLVLDICFKTGYKPPPGSLFGRRDG